MGKKIILISKLEPEKIDTWLFYHLSLGFEAIELVGNIQDHPSYRLIKRMQKNHLVEIKDSIDACLSYKTKEHILCITSTSKFLLVQKNLTSIRVLINEYFYEDYISVWENIHFPEGKIFRGTCYLNYSEVLQDQARFGYKIQDTSLEFIEKDHYVLSKFYKQIKLREKEFYSIMKNINFYRFKKRFSNFRREKRFLSKLFS